MRPLLLLALVSCTAGDAPPADTDTDAVDATDDTELPADTGDSDDTAAPDTDDTDDVTPDSDTADTGACAPIPLQEVMALCNDVPTVVSYWADPEDDTCPAEWEAGGVTGATVDDVLDAAGCERSCVYRLHQSVMLLYCGSRGEYLRWVPDAQGQVGAGDTCEDWLEVFTVLGGGWYRTWEAYEADFPCPNDTGDTADTGADSDTDVDSDAAPDTDTDTDTN